MEPVPESARLLDQLGKLDHGLPGIATLGQQIQDLVPSCIGLSLTILEDGITITLVSSSTPIASLDALQYLDGGPCQTSIRDGEIQHWTHARVLEESPWQLFGEGESNFGIESTLSLPVRRDDEVTASVNLYATRPDAFDAELARIAELCGSSVAEAVRNADLNFSTRLRAAAAPIVMAERHDVDLAIGLLAGILGLDVQTAEERLRTAAARAGISVVHLARLLKEGGVP
jgi:GAF domain-containing protein